VIYCVLIPIDKSISFTFRQAIGLHYANMAVLLAFPILSILLILQSAIISRVPLVQGTADLILLALIAWSIHKRVKTAWHWGVIGGLMVSFVSAMPFGVPLVGYLLAVGLTLILRRRVWQAPILAMFVATFLGTLVIHLLDLIALRLVGNPLSWLDAVNQITLPSILLNLLLAIPAYAILGDLANWLHPEQLEM